MAGRIYTIGKYEPNPFPNSLEVDTTSHGPYKQDLSPFYLGWVLHRGEACYRFENYWQYSKVYRQHWDDAAKWPTPEYFQWRADGFKRVRANRYPMGKGAKPVCSFHDNVLYDYVDARKAIYIPFYMNLVVRTNTYNWLYNQYYFFNRTIVLRDFDGYNSAAENLSLNDVVNNPRRKMGHAFVIMGMITGEINNVR